MIVKMDDVLWQFAKFYRKKFNAENFDKIEMATAAVATLQAMKASGHAAEELRRWCLGVAGDAEISRCHRARTWPDCELRA
jgi:hypothetical protein